MAFETFRRNLVDRRGALPGGWGKPFRWPEELEKKAWDINTLITSKRHYLKRLGDQGDVDLVAGGPPCQGFSFAGRRRKDDPRNQLFWDYLDVVALLRPRYVLIENVKGIATAHGKSCGTRRCESYADVIRAELERRDPSRPRYRVRLHLVEAKDYGVPQLRPRYLILGVREDLLGPRDVVPDLREFMENRGPVSVRQAISDLEGADRPSNLVPCEDSGGRRGYVRVRYRGPRTGYQREMHEGLPQGEAPNSLRLPRHTDAVRQRFRRILEMCESSQWPRVRRGTGVPQDVLREELGTRKTAVVPLDPDKPSHTVTTLPDDLVHYSEPRILTVRELARLQSFPDWFEFHGKYTTGGRRRVKECPRYTQVGNAVPPLLAREAGKALLAIDRVLSRRTNHAATVTRAHATARRGSTIRPGPP